MVVGCITSISPSKSSSSEIMNNGVPLLQLIELHDGNVWVESQYGKYSIFGFNLPLSPDDKNLQ